MLPSEVWAQLRTDLEAAGFTASASRPAAVTAEHLTLTPGTPVIEFATLARRAVHRIDVTCWIPAVQPLHRLADLVYRVRLALSDAGYLADPPTTPYWLDEAQLVGITLTVRIATDGETQ